ncbi:S41 family peptidase [Patescibacteria group bacterium]|nr:S41 family peptidase [Patescibacteria group bacterium]
MISTKRYIATVAVLLAISVGSFFGGLNMGKKGFVYSGHDFQIVNQNNQTHVVDYNLLWQVLDTLNQKYIDKPIDQQKALYGAVEGAVSSLGDPYTVFFDPQQYNDFKTQLAGSFEGIGAEVGLKDGNLIIVAPIAGAPAEKAGLKAGDIVLKIDGTDTTGMTLDDAVNKIRGPKGTQVKLTIFRTSTNKQMDLTITRATIAITSVKWSYKTTTTGKKIAVIQVSQFGDDTVDLFRKAVADIQTQNVAGVVIDLRDDPGGYLDDAVQLASYWLDKDQLVVSEKHSDGSDIQYTAKGGNVFKGMPTVVLINGGSASASEILSGALHDHGDAKLVGQKSFGKGSVQELIDMPQNTALKVTVAKWYTPNGININKNGIEPDYQVDFTATDAQSNKDPQMDKALDLLK